MATRSHTALYPKLKKIIDDECRRLQKEKITPWVFLNTGNPFEVEKHDGSLIRYEGVEFSGSPSDVFWSGYIEPFLEDFIIKTLKWTSNQCEENKLKPDKSLEEATELLKAFVVNIYGKMAGIDQTLGSRGHPDHVARKNVSGEIARMSKFLDSHVNSEKALWKSRIGSQEKNRPPRPTSNRAKMDRLHENYVNKVVEKFKSNPHLEAPEIIEYSSLKTIIRNSGLSEQNYPQDTHIKKKWIPEARKKAKTPSKKGPKA